ncbi:TetR/AcrR family transcriptional regulator [Paenibacillus sp. P96]|uniref:TetR/AcrR family transcriptional regulator n=1 Tax=Paenibacillus zeirhizosphaerae TaxID=2987519 RepID=A0ABT9FV51_9BACL|nr:TetR/AcrR family transcriptional regulator [Paenibacillus sp. P96]MDP4098613.1 TetR/AcrR family transcriptional regulator [Paenibacillus sp. P96]
MDNKRDDIVQAAIRLFSKKGFAATSVEEIAKESGIAKASFYKYFQGKHELPLAACSKMEEEIEKGIKALYSQAGLSSREKLFQFIKIYLNNIIGNKTHMLLIAGPFPANTHDEQTNQALEEHEKRIFRWIHDCLLDVYGPDLEQHIWDITFILMSVTFEYIRVFGDRMEQESIDKLADFILYITDSLINGMRQQSGPPSFLWGLEGWFGSSRDADPFQEGKQIAGLLERLEEKLMRVNMGDSSRHEYLDIIGQLRQETSASTASNGLLKALLSYLEQLDDLNEDALKLRGLLGL